MSGEHPDQKVIEELVAGIRAQKNGSAVAVVNSHGESPAVGDGPQLTDTQILTKLFSEREGDKWRAVYGGEWGSYYASQSEADSAFLHKLAFYSSDPAQIERIMRGSSLAHAREKWDSRRNGSSWLSLEINRAIENTLERFTPRREDDRIEPYSRSPSSLGMRNDLKRSIQAVSFRGRRRPGPRKWLVERAIWEEHVATWYGAGGIAKSLLAVHLGMTLADPSTPRWAGLEVKTAPVLYGDFELDEDEHLRRSQEIAAGMGLDDVPEHFYYLPLVGLATREAFALAAEECRRLGAKLFVVDSVGFALDGDSELSKDVLKFHRECLQPIKDAGAAPLLIDHQAKLVKGERYSDKQEFGSVYKTNATRSSFQIRGAWDRGNLTTTFTHKKTNFGPKVDDFSLKVTFGTGAVKVELLTEAVPDPDKEPTKKELVLDAVVELGRTTAEGAAQKTGINIKTVQNAFAELLGEGVLADTGEKAGRSRIVMPRSRTTKGTGTGTKPRMGILSSYEGGEGDEEDRQ